MDLFRQTFRQWWQIPRRASEPIDHRTVTFLELFYDLVYVVLIAQLSHALAKHVGMTGFLQFAFLFIMVWWAWLNGTLYHDIHGNNDIRTRVFTFLQMIAVAAMAVFAHDAMGETSRGFALSYAAFLLILTYLWWRSGYHDDEHRPLSTPYVRVFLIAAGLFVISAFVPAPWRFYLWGVGLLLSILMPAYTISTSRREQGLMEQLGFMLDVSPSAVERFGLFNIIVLGEVVVGVVQGLAGHHDLTWGVGITALLGMGVAFGMWWVYFDFVSHRKPLTNWFSVVSWLYLHLPLTISITAVGAAVLNVVEHAGEHMSGDVRWLLTGSIMVAFITIALLIQTVQFDDVIKSLVRLPSIVVLVVGVMIGALGFTQLETIPLLLITLVLMLVPVIAALSVWVQQLANHTDEIETGDTLTH